MRLSVYVALAATVVLVALARPVARRLQPQVAAVSLAAAALTAATVWVIGLALLAVATVGRLGLVAALGHWSAATVRALDPVPVGAGIAGSLLLVVASAGLVLSAGRLAAGTRELWRLRHLAGARRCGELVVVDSPRPEALAVPGLHGRVLVTSGMLRALDVSERRVLFAHERCHLRRLHWVYRLTIRAAAAVYPLCRPLVADCDQALERWADEAAAGDVGDRQLAARAVATAALAAHDHRSLAGGVAAGFSGAGVTERVSALLAPPAPRRRRPLALLAGAGVLTVLATVEASRDLEALFEVAKHVWQLQN